MSMVIQSKGFGYTTIKGWRKPSQCSAEYSGTMGSDLKIGFMSEKIITEFGNSIGKFISSCPSNFAGVWRDYFRVRVAVDVTKPLKRRMKIKKTAEEWYWISLKYENVPTFCFICGVLGHSEKFCSRLFVAAEADIVKPYGSWMRAPFRRQVKPIGAKWLRDGSVSSSRKFEEIHSQEQNRANSVNPDPHSPPHFQEAVNTGGNLGDPDSNRIQKSGGTDIRNVYTDRPTVGPINEQNVLKIIESKKRRTYNNMGYDNQMGLNPNVLLATGVEEDMNIEQTGPSHILQDPKNEQRVGAQVGAHLTL